jgi:hypothetical protein
MLNFVLLAEIGAAQHFGSGCTKMIQLRVAPTSQH